MSLKAAGSFGQHESWGLGLDEWTVSVWVSWDGDENDLVQAVLDHARIDSTDVDVTEVLSEHGVCLDDQGEAWVGDQEVVIAKITASLSVAAGRMAINDGADLFEAADALSGDLEALVGPLVAQGADDNDDDLWCADVYEQWPGAFITSSAILLRAVHITPVMRGHLLGAWIAAQSVALFNDGRNLVATKAAPLNRRDAVPDIGENEHRAMTPAEEDQWNAEQRRLADHWATHLGLTPLPDRPAILTWHTSHINTAIDRTLEMWA